jgi:DNA-binding MarR family transcriptional regulator
MGRLLLIVFSEFEAKVFQQLEREGDGGVRRVHFHVLRHVDYDTGTRLVELARRAGITKGAMGQLASECQRLGFVEIQPDRTDRRAKMVTFSRRGRDIMDRLGKILNHVERDFARRVGSRRYQDLLTTLALLRDEIVRERERDADGNSAGTPSITV